MQVIGLILSLFLLLIGIFQILLAAGLPFGEPAWGGQKGKVLPRNYRIASVFSCLFFIFSILVVLSATKTVDLFGASFVNRYMWFLTVYLGLGIIMNAISRSKIERYWAPVIVVMFGLSLMVVL
jgi:DNA integrity scanning protein DisA with diadenylate cyclase activity